MFVALLVLRNVFRHKLRTLLTALGIVVAIASFGLLRTVVDAWYAGANASSSARLVTRSSVSLVFALPLTYAQKIRQVPGVAGVSWANWFGGVYITERNFFPQFAVDAPSYLAMYPEFTLTDSERKAFYTDRQGAIAGRKLADQYGWKVGDTIPLKGTIYPGTWNFNLRGIYRGADKTVDESTMFFHFDFLNESVKKIYPRRGDQAGVFIVHLRDPAEAAQVSAVIDQTFANSLAETLTETEKAFQLSFVAMTEAKSAAATGRDIAHLQRIDCKGMASNPDDGEAANAIFGTVDETGRVQSVGLSCAPAADPSKRANRFGVAMAN